MKKVALLAIYTLLAISAVNAQVLKFSFQFGIGSLAMDELKDYDARAANLLGLDPRIIESYPTYFYYQPSLSLGLERFDIGFAYTRHSSGSRYSTSDYSGTYLYDSRISSNALSILAEGVFNPRNKLQFSWYGELGLLLTKLLLEEKLDVGNESVINESYDFHATNGFLEPGLSAGYKMGMVKLYLSLGYLLQFGKGEFMDDFDRDHKLRISGSDDYVKPAWGGYRLGLGASLTLGSRDTTN